MAQTGYTPISIYYSATTTNVPTAGNLVAGELAINTADGKLFYKDSSGVVQVIGTKGGVGSSTTTQVLYNSSGLVVGSANLTFNGTTLTTANDASISGLTVGKGGGAQTYATAFGTGALASNTTGYGTAIGYNAGNASITGTAFTAVGAFAGQVATGGLFTAIGQGSLSSLTTGTYNVAVGLQDASGIGAMRYNTTGSFNSAFGTGALGNNTTASNNTAVGYQAGYSNTTNGYSTYVGAQAGYSTTGVNNTFIGQGAGNAVTTGANNTILGTYTGNGGGLDIRTSSNYIVLSDGAGNPRGIFDNGGSFSIGGPSNTGISSGVNGIGLTTGGYGVVNHNAGTASGTPYWYFGYNGTTIGTITQNGTTGVLYNIVSDRRLKENIVDAPSALSLIDSVKVRSFDFKSDGSHTEFGLIAQEFYEVAPECVSKGDDGEEIEKVWGLDSSALVPALIKAIQEQQALITTMQAKLKDAGILGF